MAEFSGLAQPVKMVEFTALTQTVNKKVEYIHLLAQYGSPPPPLYRINEDYKSSFGLFLSR